MQYMCVILPVYSFESLLVKLRNCHVQLRYANNSQYKNDTMIRKEVYCNPAVLEELKRIITDSEVRRV